MAEKFVKEHKDRRLDWGKVRSREEIISCFHDGQTIAVGGQAGCNAPWRLIDCLMDSGAKHLTIYSIDCHDPGIGIGKLIRAGRVRVDGAPCRAPEQKVDEAAPVLVDGVPIAAGGPVYLMLNKPAGVVSSTDEPGECTVLDLLGEEYRNIGLFPAGRLDKDTEGLLLLTNDGDLASKLTHPKYVKKKIYHVWTDKDIAEEDMQRIADGIELDDGPIHADAISYATDTDRNQAGIEIHSGRNRIVRRIFESLGYHVTKLDRVYFAGLTKKNLPKGRWRYLTQEEVNFLKMGSFE